MDTPIIKPPAIVTGVHIRKLSASVLQYGHRQAQKSTTITLPFHVVVANLLRPKQSHFIAHALPWGLAHLQAVQCVRMRRCGGVLDLHAKAPTLNARAQVTREILRAEATLRRNTVRTYGHARHHARARVTRLKSAGHAVENGVPSRGDRRAVVVNFLTDAYPYLKVFMTPETIATPVFPECIQFMGA
jgi:hypothetical protein